jgi:xylulokinase
MRLCGLGAEAAFIDRTYLHFSGFADNRRARWDPELCRRFRLDPGLLPRVVEAHEIVGQLSPTAARRCGLPRGVPVAAGCGDTAASFLACGAVREGVCVDVAGTASVFATTVRSFRADRKGATLACGASAVPGLWHPYAYVNGGGMNLEWFRGRIAGAAGLEELERLAAAAKPSEADPLFVPHLGGRVCPSRPGLRGAWVGLQWTHGAGHLYRAVLEAVALEYALYLGIMRALHPASRPREVRVTGGGAGSALWNRIKADALGLPVVAVRRPEGAPLGSALIAGRAAGVFADLKAAARRWVGTGGRAAPRRGVRGHYRRRLARYRRLLRALDEEGE